MVKRTKRLLFPVLNGNKGALLAYSKVLSEYIDTMHKAIYQEVLSRYENHHVHTVNDAIFDDLVLIFRSFKERFTRSKALEQAAKDFTQYNFDFVFRRKNQFVKEQNIPLLRFRPSSRAKQILKQSIADNVQKIKTIPEKYLDDVQTRVITAASKGWDLHKLRDELTQRYEITQRRADFIALSQQRLATTELDRQTNQDAGIYKMMWVHTPGLRYPRPSHLQAGQQKQIFDNRQGCLIDGEYIQPGQLYGCQCNGRAVLEYDD